MFEFLLNLFGTKNERELKKLLPIVERINSFESEIKKLSDTEMKKKTEEFIFRLTKGETLDDILPEAFALVREASIRVLGMRPFDEQLIGGIVLHQGKIAEMKTGEGKTLAATMPAYLNALDGKKDIKSFNKGVHIVTVNDYLAKRDAQWMGPVYEFLGLTVGYIQSTMNDQAHKINYEKDITYGTNNEFGFDYLRDNMVPDKIYKRQRELNFVILDEVDSILIDEARTPLIISGPAEESTDKYYIVNRIVSKLIPDTDYEIDEKQKSIALTEDGISHIEELLGMDNLYSQKNFTYVHHIIQAIKAHKLFHRDVDYVVRNGEVLIVDEFTGRLMEGRRYSDGLHQALEAKENVHIERENQTLASITFQNFFRLYNKISGMTGTADTEALEFKEIYSLDVIVIPTHKPMIRIDHADRIYGTEKEKFDAICDEIEELHRLGRPILVGTISIENSEKLSRMLQKRGIRHSVLNAKHHEQEALIIAQAGHKGAVTIATNMAGRGTDIKLGEGVVELGGLHILGTERHESRRIDNQLRGRSGRQGDPGSSRFFISLEDNLMRLFGGEKVAGLMSRMGLRDGQNIEHSMISRSIEKAQQKVETYNFDIRKRLLEYDNVMNEQRKYIYNERNFILENDDIEEIIRTAIYDITAEKLQYLAPANESRSHWELEEIDKWMKRRFKIAISFDTMDINKMSYDDFINKIYEYAFKGYMQITSKFGSERQAIERWFALNIIDTKWKSHLLAMDHLREGIWTTGYAGKDPLLEYKFQGFELFSSMIQESKKELIYSLLRLEIEHLIEPDYVNINAIEEHTDINPFNINAPEHRQLQQHSKISIQTTANTTRRSHRKKKRGKKR